MGVGGRFGLCQNKPENKRYKSIIIQRNCHKILKQHLIILDHFKKIGQTYFHPLIWYPKEMHVVNVSPVRKKISGRLQNESCRWKTHTCSFNIACMRTYLAVWYLGLWLVILTLWLKYFSNFSLAVATHDAQSPGRFIANLDTCTDPSMLMPSFNFC